MEDIPPHDFMGAPWPPPQSDLDLISTIPDHLKRTRTFKYDAQKYPFRKIIASIVCPDHPLDKLEKLHEGEEFVDRIGNKNANLPQHGGRTVFSKRWRSRENACPELADEFRTTLGLFIEEIVVPLLYADGEVATMASNPPTLFQRSPTFRAHMPGTDRANGHRHRDYTYKRQPTEINVWLPVTGPIFASNGLYAESVPDANDFQAFSSEGDGMAILFWGNQLSHYSLPNTTDVSRISIDFRVIRGDLFIEDYIAPYVKDGHARFRRGGNYTDLEEERRWRIEYNK
ncbi:hypothetical protein TrST_g9535 [Triparma strigata]|uniref:Uncharacterized protein n=1 Tax=Triparma strigata TaxID=1606541 RepID=A0A9W7E4U1_9STRA|nr:hypothetical protein TrST_g9535 [Triparma strigata]